MPSNVTALDTPFVPLMLFHGAGSIVVSMKRYPGKSGAVLCTNFPFSLTVLLVSGRKTLKPCLFKFVLAVTCPLGFV